MADSKQNLGLLTDFYELAMAQGYFFCGKKNESATFDYFFRTNPYDGGFTVFAGLADFLLMLNQFTFSKEDIDFLAEQGFKAEFLNYLKDFRFSGNIFSMNEGEIIFPNEPVLRVESNIIEAQIIESMLLNILNFESLIATKAFRIKLVAGVTVFSDFGLRRAQGLGALHASRAAYIGGAASTSNVMAGKLFDIPVSGTMAHSWIQSFENELDAFRAFSTVNDNNLTLLVDTYNTLRSGIPNAIIVAKELLNAGKQLNAIRLDSGDLAYLSKKARKMLDDAGLKAVKIIASNQLNEHVVKSLLHDQKAPIDAFGIGTELITGKPDAALDGVYKLSEVNQQPKMKLSENMDKTTLPGNKQVYRFFDDAGNFYVDGIFCSDEKIREVNPVYHPVYPEKNLVIGDLKCEPLLQPVIVNGKILSKSKTPKEIHSYLLKRAELLPDEHKRFISPHIYKVGISKKLLEIRNELSKQLKSLN
ncbi:MAG: nicotinate phosphoribosyltransferase [Prolixibacteraceae bacterium]|nr:nicotinate phosphoribosyltransferase [Prolixibacteraceae bacterium]